MSLSRTLIVVSDLVERAKRIGAIVTGLLRAAWFEYQRDRAEYLAVAMIYYAVVSLIPLLSLLLSVLGLLLRFSSAAANVEQRMMTSLEANFGTELPAIITAFLEGTSAEFHHRHDYQPSGAVPNRLRAVSSVAPELSRNLET